MGSGVGSLQSFSLTGLHPWTGLERSRRAIGPSCLGQPREEGGPRAGENVGLLPQWSSALASDVLEKPLGYLGFTLSDGAWRHLHPSIRGSIASPRTASPGGSAPGAKSTQLWPMRLALWTPPLAAPPPSEIPSPVTSGTRWLLPVARRQGLAPPLGVLSLKSDRTCLGEVEGRVSISADSLGDFTINARRRAFFPSAGSVGWRKGNRWAVEGRWGTNTTLQFSLSP